MNIGFGNTVLVKGLDSGRLDGIGVYSQSLLEEFKKSEHKIFPQGFYIKKNKSLNHFILKEKLLYSIHCCLSALFSRPIGGINTASNELDLFFAPDHHIPYLMSTPVIATVMDIIPFIHPEWTSSRLRQLKNFAFKKAILSANHIITISEYSKNDILKYFPIDEKNISVVTLGVDKKYFKRIPEQAKYEVLKKYNLEKEFFIFIGTLQPRKNIIRILDAFDKLPADIKEQNQLVIVGQNGWNTDVLINRLRHLESTGYGKWLNYIPEEDMLALLQSAISLIYPSLYEGFGLPIVEAFASHCPVISSNITSIPEVAGDAALLVDPYSTEEITDAMYKIATNANLRKHLILKGLEQVKKFSWEKSAEQHLEVFQKVVGK